MQPAACRSIARDITRRNSGVFSIFYPEQQLGLRSSLSILFGPWPLALGGCISISGEVTYKRATYLRPYNCIRTSIPSSASVSLPPRTSQLTLCPRNLQHLLGFLFPGSLPWWLWHPTPSSLPTCQTASLPSYLPSYLTYHLPSTNQQDGSFSIPLPSRPAILLLRFFSSCSVVPDPQSSIRLPFSFFFRAIRAPLLQP